MVPICRVRMGSAGVWAPVWTASGIGYWKRLIKISAGTDCYYCINHMTCSIHVYYCLFTLLHFCYLMYHHVTCIFCTSYIFHGHTIHVYVYSAFHVFTIPCILCKHTLDTLFLNNHDHYSIIISIYFMRRCSYLSSLYCHVTSTISSNSRYKVIKTWHV